MNIDQLKCMNRNGMYIGSHGYDHHRLNELSPEKQEDEIKLSLDFLKMIGSKTDRWVMCYPYGAYDDSLINIIKRKGCKMALTTKVGISYLEPDNAFTLERLDTNDLPKNRVSEPNTWTNTLTS